jgi:hypothetical protein
MNYELFSKCLIVCLIIFSGCKQKNAETVLSETSNWSKCPVGKPVAIFSDTMSIVKKHEFALAKDKAIEKMLLANGDILEVEQTGCNKVRQIFTFTIKGDYQNKDITFWANKAGAYFTKLGTASPQLFGLTEFGKVIGVAAPKMTLGAPFATNFGITITVDRVASPTESTLMVTLQQD